MLVQGAVDESVEAGAPAGPEKDPAGTEVADADMADAADEAEDGVTPQKRKTSPQDVVSYSCSPFVHCSADACGAACVCRHPRICAAALKRAPDAV